MTQEQKAKAYDEAIEKLRGLLEGVHEEKCDIMEEDIIKIFPELKESEDERIRKSLIILLQHFCKGYRVPGLDFPVSYKDMLAWLEKQGEQELIDKIQLGKMYKCIASPRYSTFVKGLIYVPQDKFLCSLMNFCSDCFEPIEDGEQKPTDKVEPKFKQGEWIVWQDKCYKVNYNGCGYELVDQNGLSTSLKYGTINENAHLWDITKDAKDGDVLYSPCCKLLWIYKDNNSCYVGNNLSYNENCLVVNSSMCISSDICPATKEQRDALFARMKEASYEWDAKKKELKKVEQNPVWSEEDEMMFARFAACLAYHYHDGIITRKEYEEARDWFNILKERAQPKQQGWSEEDERKLNDVIRLIENSGHVESIRKHYVDWLKSLRPQKQIAWTKEDAERFFSCLKRLGTGNPSQPETINSKWFREHVSPQKHWKPSDEQMETLLSEVTAWTKGCPKQIVLESLYNDLKKLK